MGKVTIAAVAIMKNEEKDLPGFLNCLLPWIDEIVIVDDGSTDSSLEILAKAGSKVKVVCRSMESEGGFSAQRNYGINSSESDWLLHMDIDERVTPELAQEVIEQIQDKRINALRYRRLNYFLHQPMRYGGWQYWNRPQLARRGYHRFENVIHEECKIEGEDNQIGQLENHMLHFADDGYVERVEKNVRYMQLSGQEILNREIKIRWYHLIFHPFYRFFKSYFLQHGWRAGTRGFLLALYSFSSVFNWWAYAWEKQNRVSREDLEKESSSRWAEAISKNKF